MTGNILDVLAALGIDIGAPEAALAYTAISTADQLLTGQSPLTQVANALGIHPLLSSAPQNTSGGSPTDSSVKKKKHHTSKRRKRHR